MGDRALTLFPPTEFGAQIATRLKCRGAKRKKKLLIPPSHSREKNLEGAFPLPGTTTTM